MRRSVRLVGVLAVLVATLLAGVLVRVPAQAGTTGTTETPGAAGRWAADDPARPVELVLFWGDGCPHCEAERQWLRSFAAARPNLTVREYEVWHHPANQRLFEQTAQRLGFEVSGVPTTVVGERVWVGFSEAVAAEIEQAVAEASTGSSAGSGTARETVDVPLFGEVDLASRSLVASTLLIGFVDGVNPCSLWVISVLLALVVRSGSRGRVLAVGGTFLAVTAGMYALYMAGIYSAMTVVAHLAAIRLVAALLAALVGLVSVKDYLALGRGVSFTIPARAKPGIYRRIRAAQGRQALVGALGATALLAVAVSLLETPCTAGFPVLWTGMLAAAGVGTAEAAGLFVLYMVPFLLDELLVLVVVAVTMRRVSMQERHGQLLKLLAGTTMLALAGALLLRPQTLADPVGALVVFGLAVAVAALVHLVTTRLGDARTRGQR